MCRVHQVYELNRISLCWWLGNQLLSDLLRTVEIMLCCHSVREIYKLRDFRVYVGDWIGIEYHLHSNGTTENIDVLICDPATIDSAINKNEYGSRVYP